MPLSVILEPARSTPVAWEGDLCVVGGSCTGVFAAVRAARLGLSVAIVEQTTVWGGMATAAQVNEWHSLRDAFHENDIIGGLTREVVERMRACGDLREAAARERCQFRFNPAGMVLALDDLIRERPPGGGRIRPFLGARCVAAAGGDAGAERSITAVVIEDKSGRRALRASYFVDATGDADLLRHAGFAARKPSRLQPATLQALVSGLDEAARKSGRPLHKIWPAIRDLARDAGYPLENSAPWFMEYPGVDGVMNVFGPRMHGVDGSDADALTGALMEGRRFHHALLELIERRFGARARIAAWPHALGIRETWHARCRHELSGEELLDGVAFDDSIACGTYPVDIHSPEGTSLYYLDGVTETVARDGGFRRGRWRAAELTPACYHIPLRSLLPEGSSNLIVAGRALDADERAFGAVRVMVNMNQTGEAAGTACALARRDGTPLEQVPPEAVREALCNGGSLLPLPKKSCLEERPDSLLSNC